MDRPAPGYFVTSQSKLHIRVMTDVNVITSTLTANNGCTGGLQAACHRLAITCTYEDSNLSTFLNGAKPQPVKLTHRYLRERFMLLLQACLEYNCCHNTLNISHYIAAEGEYWSWQFHLLIQAQKLWRSNFASL